MSKADNIKETLLSVITKSKADKKPTNIVANEMAEKIFDKFV